MKQTNLQKWNYYLTILNEKASVFMDTIIPFTPDVFYKVNQIGTINKCTVLNRHYSFEPYLFFTAKQPTKKDIEIIERVFNNKIDFKSERAYFDYSYEYGVDMVAKTAIQIKDILFNNMAFLSLEDAEIKAKELIAQNAEERLFKETNKKDSNYNYTANGYKFLGWQNGWKHVYFDEEGNVTEEHAKKKSFGYLPADYPEYTKCKAEKHRRIEVSCNQRGTENIVSCPTCRVYWKYDSSD